MNSDVFARIGWWDTEDRVELQNESVDGIVKLLSTKVKNERRRPECGSLEEDDVRAAHSFMRLDSRGCFSSDTTFDFPFR